jgi:hypothetical protein
MKVVSQILSMREVFDAQESGFSDFSESRSSLSVFLYQIDCLDAFGLTLKCPDSHVFCSFPESRMSSGRGHFLPESRGPWEKWLDQQFVTPGLGRRFLAELRRNKVAAAKVPFGLFPYVGGTALEGDIGYGKRIPPPSEYQHRTYLIPRNDDVVSQAISTIGQVVAERGDFGIRHVNLPEVDPIEEPFGPDDVSEQGMLWSFCGCISRFEGNERWAWQERCLSGLRQAVERAEAGVLPVFSALHPPFREWSVRMIVPRQRAPTIAMLNDEVIASLRVRLAILTGWPVFYGPVGLLETDMKERLSIFPDSQQSLPYDIIGCSTTLQDRTVSRFPSYGQDLFDSLFAQCHE